MLPDGYEQSGERYRALYLLHGLIGDYMDWSTRTDLARFAYFLPWLMHVFAVSDPAARIALGRSATSLSP